MANINNTNIQNQTAFSLYEKEPKRLTTLSSCRGV